MNPQDWQQGMENEAASVTDQAWARETRQALHWQKVKFYAWSTLSLLSWSVLLGALLCQFTFWSGRHLPSFTGTFLVTLDDSSAISSTRITDGRYVAGLWPFAQGHVLWLSALLQGLIFGTAVLLGRRGIRPFWVVAALWPVPLLAAAWSNLVLFPAFWTSVDGISLPVEHALYGWGGLEWAGLLLSCLLAGLGAPWGRWGRPPKLTLTRR